MRPYLDKSDPDAWQAVSEASAAVTESARAAGTTDAEIELVTVRISQVNACDFCLDLHSRQARDAGLPQQKLDVLPAWRESSLFDPRETAMLAIAEAATRVPHGEEARADLESARGLLGDEVFAAVEWVAVMINLFNRISILSEHPTRPRDSDGELLS